MAQSELLEPGQVREEYAPPVAKGVVESSINGSEIKNGNRNHSVNGIGGSTFRNSVPGEKAIASIQGTERHLENYCRKQKVYCCIFLIKKIVSKKRQCIFCRLLLGWKTNKSKRWNKHDRI
jgi:hypothetical protein